MPFCGSRSRLVGRRPHRRKNTILCRVFRKVATTGATEKGPGYRCGETHPNARLTDAEVEQIRCLHEDGVPCSELAAQFDCARSTISSIVNYRHRVSVPYGEHIVLE
jgi:hypothetical protein